MLERKMTSVSISKSWNSLAFSSLVSLSVLTSVGVLSGCSTMQMQTTKEPTVVSGYGVPTTERTLAQRILDQSIENTVLTNINAINPSLHKVSRIGVDSFYSTVLLTGEVPDEFTRQQVVKIVSAMPDVKQVYDRLNVSAQKGVSYTVHDGYITSKLTAKILANSAIKTSQIHVVTDDGVVYVLGRLTPTQRGHLVSVLESTVGVKEAVILTSLIDDNGALIDESSVRQEIGLEPPSYDSASTTPVDSYQGGKVTIGTTTAAPQNTVSPSTINTTSPKPSTPTTTNPNPINSTEPNGNTPNDSGSSAYIEMYKNQVPGWE